MTVVMVSSSEMRYDVSDASRNLYLSSELNKSGISTVIIGSYSEKNIRDSNIIEVKPYIQNLFGRIFLRVQISCIALKQMIATKSKYCIVRGFDMILVACFARFLGNKILYDFHGYRYREEISEGKMWRAIITKIFDILMLRLTDHIIAVSEGIRQEIPGKYRQKTIILPNGVDPELFKYKLTDREKDDLRIKYKINKNKKVVGFVGTFSEWFDFEDLLGIKGYTTNNIIILLIGDGEAYSKLKMKIKDSNRIIVTGRLSHTDTVNLLKYVIDICIVPYKKDWFGSGQKNFFSSRKITEYLMAGKPIIISEVRGIPGYIQLNKNYISYSPGNLIDLSKKIKILLENDEMRFKMQTDNIELSKNFTWENLVKNSGLIQILASGHI